MRSRIALALGLFLSLSCGSAGDDGTGGTGGGSNSGPLVDNTQWKLTDQGAEFFGAPPPGATCDLTPIDCPEYPWPEGECVNFVPGSSCISAVVPECLDAYTVLSIYTRMPDTRIPLCNWITLEQPSLRAIAAGDQVEVRARHSALTAPVTSPPTQAHMGFVIGDESVLDYSVLIPSDYVFPSRTWTAPKDYPAGTRLLWHVDNHGSNEYMLIEVNIL
ncbi:MAG: hypothetical protein WCE62_01400 [Polyangiales bacterium]